MKLLFATILLCISTSIFAGPASRNGRNPVILIPGNGGNRLEAKVNIANPVNIFCKKRSDDYFLLWVNPKYFFPFIINCFVNMMRLIRDPATGLTSNSPGVDIRVPGWGQTYAVEWLSTLKVGPVSYYKSLVDSLVTMGYQRDVDIRGAPYDFRKAPNELGQYFSDLKQLIEETSTANGNLPVVLIAHSFGGPVTLHFLEHQTQEWKNTFIKNFVSIAGAYAGSTVSVKVMASGDFYGFPTVNPLIVRQHQRTLPSTAYLLPKLPAWRPDSVVAMTDQRNYTISDYDSFYRDMGVPEAIPLTRTVINVTDLSRGPGVPVHCVLTRHTPTPAIYDWRGLNFPDHAPNAVNGEGDGTVNWQSLQMCSDFSKLQTQPVTTMMIEDTDHSAILKDKRLFDFVKTVV